VPFARDRHKIFETGEGSLRRGSFTPVFENAKDLVKQYDWNGVVFEGAVARNGMSWPNNCAESEAARDDDTAFLSSVLRSPTACGMPSVLSIAYLCLALRMSISDKTWEERDHQTRTTETNKILTPGGGFDACDYVDVILHRFINKYVT